MNIDYCYRVFNLTKTASEEEISSRYKELYDIYNPKSPYANEQRYKEIVEAYWTIKSYLKNHQKTETKFVVEKKPSTARTTKPLILKGGLVLSGMAAGAVVIFSAMAIKNNITLKNTDLIPEKEVVLETNTPSIETPFVVEPTQPPVSNEPVKPSNNAHPTEPTNEIQPTEEPIEPSNEVKPTEEPVVTDNIPDEEINITENGFLLKTVDGVTYVDGQLIVNKTYPLPSNYVPHNPGKPVIDEKGADYLEKEVLEAYSEMRADASKLGLSLWIASGYRSYTYQAALHEKYIRTNGTEVADSFSARAGYSEHQTGLAFDLNSVVLSFASTPEGRWINENCYKYGFIIRYPQGKSEETGYTYEPWHLRFVGKDLATKLYNGGDWTTMERYYGIKSEYIETEVKETGYTK